MYGKKEECFSNYFNCDFSVAFLCDFDDVHDLFFFFFYHMGYELSQYGSLGSQKIFRYVKNYISMICPLLKN